MWIDESAPNTEQNKVFASKIVVTSGADGEAGEPNIVDIKATSTTDSISITYNANGTTTCKYGIVEGTYDNTVANVTNTNCNITGLRENTTYYYQVCTETGKGSKCVDGEIVSKLNPKFTENDVGKYVSMTPTSTLYTISKELTGYTSDQTINPSELNLWRVIKVNSDGIVEMISDNVSSVKVYFAGQTGYLNFVGSLNTIAAQYSNDRYVQSTRHMGYNDQTESCSSISSCGSDLGYQADANIVTSAIGSLVASKPGESSPIETWMASRNIGSDWTNKTFYAAFLVITSGGVESDWLYRSDDANNNKGGAIRPIVVLKSTSIKLSGDGTENSPYQLN